MPKARLRPEDRHAVEIVGAEKIRFWTANPGVYEAAALCAEQVNSHGGCSASMGQAVVQVAGV